MLRSEKLFDRAQRVLPGGVNSPVRAFRAVDLCPRFIERADGPYIYDADGRKYIDYVCSWGPMLLGHNHPAIRAAVEQAVQHGLSFGAPTEAEVEMAELMVDMVPNIEMVRMVNSGSSALAGGHPSSAGVPEDIVKHTLTAQFNRLDTVEALFDEWPGQIACVILEPVAANMGVVAPSPGFLEGLRALCDRYGALLVFDEVITGFRLAPGGAQEYFGIKADLVTFGKIIGGGMPVGAYCGSRALMEQVAPCGPVYQAGTLSGNPVAMAAGLAQLRHIRSHPELYVSIEHSAKELAAEMCAAAAAHGTDVSINQIGSLIAPFFTPNGVTTFVDAKGSDVGRYARYFRGMLERGVYLAPAQFEAMFISTAHTKEDFQRTLEAVDAVFAAL